MTARFAAVARIIGGLALTIGMLGSAKSTALAQSAAAPVRWIDGAPTAADLAALGNQLIEVEEQRRLSAFDTLRTLPATALGAIDERFAVLGRAGVRTDDLQAALTSFRRAVGSNRADDNVDLAPGILVVTRADRSKAIGTAAEILLLLRSLEALGTADAGRAIAEGLSIDLTALSQESVRIRARLGVKLLPALVALRGHRVPEIRRWAGRGLKLLAITDPSVAFSHGDPAAVAATIRAYGSTHDLEALPAMVSLLNDPRIQVRAAARDAIRGLGRNAIWKVRVAYQEVTGASADPKWNSEQTLNELCLVFDRARIERADTALARGLTAHLAGDLPLMAEQFELALRIDPTLTARAEMAAGFAALGASRAALDDLGGAQAAYKRAVRLAPEHADGPLWRAELSYLAAERRLSRGVVDMDGYRGTLAIVADHSGAADALDRLSGAWSARAERLRRIIALTAIVLLCGFGFGVMRGRRSTPVTPAATAP